MVQHRDVMIRSQIISNSKHNTYCYDVKQRYLQQVLNMSRLDWKRHDDEKHVAAYPGILLFVASTYYG